MTYLFDFTVFERDCLNVYVFPHCFEQSVVIIIITIIIMVIMIMIIIMLHGRSHKMDLVSAIDNEHFIHTVLI